MSSHHLVLVVGAGVVLVGAGRGGAGHGAGRCGDDSCVVAEAGVRLSRQSRGWCHQSATELSQSTLRSQYQLEIQDGCSCASVTSRGQPTVTRGGRQ